MNWTTFPVPYQRFFFAGSFSSSEPIAGFILLTIFFGRPMVFWIRRAKKGVTNSLLSCQLNLKSDKFFLFTLLWRVLALVLTVSRRKKLAFSVHHFVLPLAFQYMHNVEHCCQSQHNLCSNLLIFIGNQDLFAIVGPFR